MAKSSHELFLSSPLPSTGKVILCVQKSGWREDSKPHDAGGLFEPWWILCSVKKSTWNSVEYRHGVWAFSSEMLLAPNPFSGRYREPQHVASVLISYQKRTSGMYWFVNAVWALDSEGTSQVDKMLEMKIFSWRVAASQPLWKGEHKYRQRLLSWSSSPVSVCGELLTEAHPKARN